VSSKELSGRRRVLLGHDEDGGESISWTAQLLLLAEGSVQAMFFATRSPKEAIGRALDQTANSTWSSSMRQETRRHPDSAGWLHPLRHCSWNEGGLRALIGTAGCIGVAVAGWSERERSPGGLRPRAHAQLTRKR